MINKLIVTPFGPFNIKYKKLNFMQKTSESYFYGIYKLVFHIALSHKGCPQIPFRFSWMLQYSKTELFVTKK